MFGPAFTQSIRHVTAHLGLSLFIVCTNKLLTFTSHDAISQEPREQGL
jgi:hypothetical protein